LASYAADNPLAKYLEVPGAKATLPVSSAKSSFPLDFAKDARKSFGNFHYQLGGDHALYYNLHLSEVLHTAIRRGAKYEGQKADFGESPLMNSYQFDGVFEDGALWKHGNLGQGIYIDPARDFVGVYYSTNGYIPPYGEDKLPGYLRRAAKYLAGQAGRVDAQ
jgi:hypothetical protein